MPKAPTSFILAVALAFVLAPTQIMAESLEVHRADPDGAITLAPGASVFLVSSQSFYETAVSSPLIARLATLSDTEVKIQAAKQGRTTLTLLHDGDDDSVSQVDVVVRPDGDAATASSDPIPVPPSPAPEVINVLSGVAAQEIPLAAHQSIVLKTDTPFTQIMAADPAIAAASVLWDGKGAYLVGMSAGSTTLTLQRDGGAASTQLTVVVSSPD